MLACDDAWTGRCDAMRAMRAMDGRAAARGLGWRVSSETSRTTIIDSDNPAAVDGMRCAGGKGVQMRCGCLSQTNDDNQKHEQQQLLNQESKNTPSLCSFLLRHHSLPSPPQKAGPTACAGMCCSRPAGGGSCPSRVAGPAPTPSFAWPARNARVIKGMIGTFGTAHRQGLARTDLARGLLLCRCSCCCCCCSAGACAAVDKQTAIITVRCEQLDPTT